MPPSTNAPTPPSAILSAEVEPFWRDRYEAVFGAGSLDGFTPTANGEITRAEYLQALLEHTFDDADLDKLPDAWERQHYSSIFEVESGDDFDQDGIVERLEMAMDLNPLSPDSTFPFPPEVTQDGVGRWFELIFRETTQMGESIIRLQQSPDLMSNSWEDVPVDGTTLLKETVDADPDGDGSAILFKYRVKLDMSAAQCFFRILVTDRML